jgi:hypothetical protein
MEPDARLLCNKIAVDFAFARVKLGLTFCKIAKTLPERREEVARLITLAAKALESADKTMWRLGMAHPDFNGMMAQTERLRFELQAVTDGSDTKSEEPTWTQECKTIRECMR